MRRSKIDRRSGAPTKIIFLLEEQSAQLLLNSILPRILPSGTPFKCISHQGHRALQAKIPVHLRKEKNAYYVILHDQDDKNCKKLKSDLLQICAQNNRADTVVCIACRELEAWYWGDLDAVAGVYPKFNPEKIRNKAKFRQPDNIVKPSKALEKTFPEFKKIKTAKEIGKHMDVCNNKSPSFQYFVAAVKKLARVETHS